MAYFFDVKTKSKSYLWLRNTFINFNYYLNESNNFLITIYFEENEIETMKHFVNQATKIKDIKIETFYTDQGHFLFCTKEYETKEINFLNFKKIILKNIINETTDIQNIVKKIDRNNRFIF